MTCAMFAYDQSKPSVEENIEPIRKLVRTKNSSIEIDDSISTFSKWIDVYHLFKLTQATAGGGGGVSASRLLPERALTDDIEALARLLESVGPSAEGPSVS